MKYLCLVYLEEQKLHAVPDRECMACGDGFRTSGLLVAAEALQPVETATTVRVEGGQTLLTDGPFLDAKEHLGGYFLVEADELDAALELAARVPAARMGGAVEVRPLVER